MSFLESELLILSETETSIVQVCYVKIKKTFLDLGKELEHLERKENELTEELNRLETSLGYFDSDEETEQ